MKWVKKMWYINTMEYYSTSKRDRFESFVVIWMNLEPVIQSEVSQKEESKDVLMHIYMEYRKNGTDESICRERVKMQM